MAPARQTLWQSMPCCLSQRTKPGQSNASFVLASSFTLALLFFLHTGCAFPIPARFPPSRSRAKSAEPHHRASLSTKVYNPPGCGKNDRLGHHTANIHSHSFHSAVPLAPLERLEELLQSVTYLLLGGDYRVNHITINHQHWHTLFCAVLSQTMFDQGITSGWGNAPEAKAPVSPR